MSLVRLNKYLLGLASALILFLSGCGGGVQSALNPTGPQALNVSKLWWLMFYVCGVVFVLVLVVTCIAFLRRGQRNASPDERPILHPPEEKEARKRNVVIAATAITTIILFVFLIESFFIGRGLTAELSRKQGIAIELTGHQWWWEARYMNVDASNIFTTANEIHIPVGVPVSFTLKSNDVIHSFWVPNLSGKKDLIPGKVATIWLQADQPGLYRGQCAEYCGHQHAHMALLIIAESEQQFEAWIRKQIQSAPTPTSDSQKRGQQVFLSTACVMCHAIGGTTAASVFGPNLTHVGSRQTIAAATLTNTRDHLSQWVTNSQVVKPGNRMPPNNLSSDDLQAVLDYLQSLQ